MSPCKCRPVQLLFLLRTQIESIPSDQIRLEFSKSTLVEGIPVRLYDEESLMLADFFVECMEQRQVVAYVCGNEVIRSQL